MEPGVMLSALSFAVMDPTEVARRDQVVDVDVPQRGAILCLVLSEQCPELTRARHLSAVETKPARYLGGVAAAVRRVHGIDAMGPKFMRFGPIAAVIDDTDQQLDAVTAHGLEL